MIGIALALVALGILLLFIVPWVGIPIGAVGLILVGIYAFGAARRPARPERH